MKKSKTDCLRRRTNEGDIKGARKETTWKVLTTLGYGTFGRVKIGQVSGEGMKYIALKNHAQNRKIL
jgi:hypothetical protein